MSYYTHYGWLIFSELVFGYHWLLVAIIDLLGDNTEFEVWGIFWTIIPN